MKTKLTIGLMALMLVSGCARIKQTIRTTSTDTNGVVETRETTSQLSTLFDSKQSVEKLRLSNGKTQSIGVTGVDQESSATNLVHIIDAVISAAIKAAVKP
jgi:hypothetical protein